MRLVTEGRNRLVIVTCRYAIKIPSFRCWRDFLFGLLNNLNEAEWHREHPSYCPVLRASRFGLFLIMPRVRMLEPEEWAGVAERLPSVPGAERKASSWGWLSGKLVVVDYGWR